MSAKADVANNTKTPPRNNYANPHTPIASIKRPRSSLERPSTTIASPGPNSGRNNSLTSPMPPRRQSSGIEAGAMSPMHPPKAVHRDSKDNPVVVEEQCVFAGPENGSTGSSSTSSWVNRKVDALFSPVLNFLNQQENATTAAARAGSEKDNLAETPTASESSSSPSHANNVEEEEEDEVSCGSLQPMEEDSGTDEDEFNPWQYIKSLPPYAMVSHLCPKVALPAKAPDSPQISLVLDLDETLVHCTVEPIQDADLTFPVEFHGTTYQVHVRLRPYLHNFLKKIRGNFEVIVFTASQKVYANELLNLIDPDGIYIQHRLFRESCMAVEGNFLKDLNVLGRDLAKTVIVDNSPHAFGFQVDNGIPIESWFDAPEDRELLKLAKFLDKLRNAPDVRPIVRDRFKCHERIAEAVAPPGV